MRTKICPICDQKIKGNYCKVCHKFVTPVVYDSDFKLNESRDGADYFELQLEREKEIRMKGATDLDDGHGYHPKVNQPKDRRIENLNGREMPTTQMPSSYPEQQQTAQPNRRPQGNYPQRTNPSGSGRTQNRGCGVSVGVIVFIIILIIEFIVSMVQGSKSDDWGRRPDARPAVVWESAEEIIIGGEEEA